MRSVDLFVFLAFYALASFAILVFDSLRRRSRLGVIGLVAALAALVGATMLGLYLEPGRGFSEVFRQIVARHEARHMVAAVMGAAAAAAWLGRLLPASTTGTAGGTGDSAEGSSTGWLLLDQLIVAASIAGVAGGAGLFLWNSLFDLNTASSTRSFAPEFVIEEIAEIPFLPVRVVADDSGDLYVLYYWTENNATHGGGIIKLIHDPETDSYSHETVANHDALFRALGLAEKDGDLYVTRSGYHASAVEGRLSYPDTGAVTQLKDLDGNGYFEYYHDILTGLPGGRGQDIQHQNNGLAFAPDGSLYVTNGVASRALDDHLWGGALLKLSPDFRDVRVFATGFRNPFGIAVMPNGEIFLTDNDVEENPGDELDHVIEGGHYGQPFVIPNQAGIDPIGFREPILLGPLESNFVGMAYTDSPALPDGYRDRFYIADLSKGEILRVAVEPEGDTYRVTEAEPFADIPSPVDIDIAGDGSMYVASRFDQKIFRIRPRGAAGRRGDAL